MTVNALPQALAPLAALPRFVLWRDEADQAGKRRKVPYQVNGRRASSTRPHDWSPWSRVRSALETGRYTGPGIVLGELEDGRRLMGIDLDLCRSPVTGRLTLWGQAIVDEAGTYGEVSPSGTGVKLFGYVTEAVEIPVKEMTVDAALPEGAEGTDHGAPEIGLYPAGRYFTVTGQRVECAPAELRDITDVVRRLARRLQAAREANRKAHPPKAVARLLERDAKLRRLWEDGSKPGDRSGNDLALADRLRRLGVGDRDIRLALAAYPLGQIGGKLTGDAAERRLDRILAKLEEQPPGPDQQDEPWPEPDLSLLSQHRRPAPELPLDLFGPFWSGWIADAAEAKGSRPDFVAAALVPAVGAMVANARRGSPWPGWVEPPIVWAAGIGLPSSGKSPALDAVMDLVRELERELDADFDDRTRENQVARELAKAKRERWEAEVRAALKAGKAPPEPPRGGDAPDPPARRRLYTNDPTVERIARIASADERGILLQRDELAGWLGQLDKYGGSGGDRAFYLESHGGRPYVIDRVKDGTAVRVPYLSLGILGGIQPDRLATLLLAGDDDGLAARFLYAWPEPARPRRPRRAPDGTAALGALRWLLALGPIEVEGRRMPRVLPFEPAAADDLQAWREQVADMEAHAAGLFLSWTGKLPGMAVRLALVFELLWWCPEAMTAPEPAAVSRKAARAALAFLEAYAVPMARRAFGEAALPLVERDAIALARWLHARQPIPQVVNARDLRYADALPTREAERYARAFSELEAGGWLRPAPRAPTGGRPRKDWLVSPKLQAPSP